MKKCFEAKQWKLGLKFNRQILSNPKFAEHGGKSDTSKMVSVMCYTIHRDSGQFVCAALLMKGYAPKWGLKSHHFPGE